MSNAPESRTSHVRFFIVSMLFFASTINYADRGILGMVKSNVSNGLGLDPVWMGYLVSAWAWSYVAAQIPCGWLLDRRHGICWRESCRKARRSQRSESRRE